MYAPYWSALPCTVQALPATLKKPTCDRHHHLCGAAHCYRRCSLPLGCPLLGILFEVHPHLLVPVHAHRATQVLASLTYADVMLQLPSSKNGQAHQSAFISDASANVLLSLCSNAYRSVWTMRGRLE